MKKRADYYAYGDGARFTGLSLNETFTWINHRKHWHYDPRQDSVSGPGSTRKQTSEIIKKIPEVLDSFQIGTILDIPCGDFNWMNLIDWTGRHYIGADILEDLVRQNAEKYRGGAVTFKVLDLTRDDLPPADLIFCRDCLVHFSYDDIFMALANIKRSNARYLMTTTFPDEEVNEDIPSGGWRPVNFNAQPFAFPGPLYLLNEQCTEADGLFADKSLGLWEISVLTC
ncbi:MAG: class I SAM-dependent methyltransferase [Cyclobacteriaceae bacterium]|nr:class I SAM-dependent methyltransferase [Cyclobacteriaceae bacterium]